MREIKFRAWFKPDNKMVDVLEIDFTKGAIFSGMKGKKGFQDFELMQYTGLKDKSGKEIYEGDIIRMNQLQGFADVYVGEVVIAEGVENDMRVWIKLPNNPHLQFFHKDPEVIGNIWENPELLK